VVTAALRPRNRRFDNVFFLAMAFVILVSVVIGFSQTYFAAPLPNLIVKIHAAVFALWILLLIVQTSLISAHRVELHRRLGLLGFGLSCLVVIFGVLVATENLVRNYPETMDRQVSMRAFYAITLSDMFMFSVLIYFAYRKRFDPAAHKRLVLIATFALLDAAFDRWPIHAALWDDRVTPLLCIYPLLLLLMAYDRWSRGKIQPATIGATLFLIVVQQGRDALGHTEFWQRFALWAYEHGRSFQ
jgi:hypothetical protein